MRPSSSMALVPGNAAVQRPKVDLCHVLLACAVQDEKWPREALGFGDRIVSAKGQPIRRRHVHGKVGRGDVRTRIKGLHARDLHAQRGDGSRRRMGDGFGLSEEHVFHEARRWPWSCRCRAASIRLFETLKRVQVLAERGPRASEALSRKHRLRMRRGVDRPRQHRRG